LKSSKKNSRATLVLSVCAACVAGLAGTLGAAPFHYTDGLVRVPRTIMRAGPGAGSRPLFYLQRGAMLMLMRHQGGYAKVSDVYRPRPTDGPQNQIGWVRDGDVHWMTYKAEMAYMAGPKFEGSLAVLPVPVNGQAGPR
jgi:hypothetical protein